MHHLIAHQSFNGCLPHTPAMLSWLGICAPDFARAVQDSWSGLSQDVVRDVLATALGVVFLEKKVGECKGEWELVVEKAREWVRGQTGGEGREEVLERVWAVAESLVVG